MHDGSFHSRHVKGREIIGHHGHIRAKSVQIQNRVALVRYFSEGATLISPVEFLAPQVEILLYEKLFLMKGNRSRIFEHTYNKSVVSSQHLVGNPAPSGLSA